MAGLTAASNSAAPRTRPQHPPPRVCTEAFLSAGRCVPPPALDFHLAVSGHGRGPLIIAPDPLPAGAYSLSFAFSSCISTELLPTVANRDSHWCGVVPILHNSSCPPLPTPLLLLLRLRPCPFPIGSQVALAFPFGPSPLAPQWGRPFHPGRASGWAATVGGPSGPSCNPVHPRVGRLGQRPPQGLQQGPCRPTLSRGPPGPPGSVTPAKAALPLRFPGFPPPSAQGSGLPFVALAPLWCCALPLVDEWLLGVDPTQPR